MRNPFSFEVEPFETYLEFGEQEEGQNRKPCRCGQQSKVNQTYSGDRELIEEMANFDTELIDFEWEGEVNRSSKDYIRWVQRSLNQILGLRLAVDGIMGPQTRSAIRSFQQRNGLVADGVVGPKTEPILVIKGAQPFVSPLDSAVLSLGPRGCSGVDTAMTPEEAKKIRPGGADRNGKVEDRKSELPEKTTLLAKHLTHYDVNDWRPEHKENHYNALNEIAGFIENWLTTHPDSKLGVTITGSASRTGSKEYNDILSCKRAKAAAEWLENGIWTFLNRTEINPSGLGFSKATCRTKTDCENPDYRSVLIVVHAVKNPPPPIPPEPPKGWCKYKIRSCSFKSETLITALVSELLSQSMPEKFKQYLKRYPFLDSLKNNLLKKVADWIKSRLPRAVGKFEALINKISKYIVVELIRVNAVFEIAEREKANPINVIFCYTGYGVRVKIPAIPLPKELGELIDGLPLPDFLRKTMRDKLKVIFKQGAGLEHLESKCSGPFRNFDLVRLRGSNNTPECQYRNINIFEGSAAVGTDGTTVTTKSINLVFKKDPPFSLTGIRLGNCSGYCSRNSIELPLVGSTGFELFLASEGDLKPGEQCKCIECT